MHARKIACEKIVPCKAPKNYPIIKNTTNPLIFKPLLCTVIEEPSKMNTVSVKSHGYKADPGDRTRLTPRVKHRWVKRAVTVCVPYS